MCCNETQAVQCSSRQCSPGPACAAVAARESAPGGPASPPPGSPGQPGRTDADVTAPPWLAGTFAAIMILTAAYSAGRLAFSRLQGRATELDADALHAVMGVAMAGMLVPWLHLAPNSMWVAVFGIGAAWFGWHALPARSVVSPRLSRCRYPVPHLVECAAMIYMLVPGHRPPGGSAMAMPGMGSAASNQQGFPALAVILALFSSATSCGPPTGSPPAPPSPRPPQPRRAAPGSTGRRSPPWEHAHPTLPALSGPMTRPARQPLPPGSPHAPRSRWASPWATCSSSCSNPAQAEQARPRAAQPTERLAAVTPAEAQTCS